MTTFFITLGGESQRRLLPLLVKSGLLLICTTAVAAAPSAQLPDVLTVANSDAESAGLPLYQPLPKQSITMPPISNWQDANNRVKELGGWMFYASEADAPVSAQPVKLDPKRHSKHQHHADKTPEAVTPAKDQP